MPDPLDPPSNGTGGTDPLDPLGGSSANAVLGLTSLGVVERKSVARDGAGGVTETWSDIASLPVSLSRLTKYLENSQSGEVKAVSTWSAKFPVRSDVLPSDRLKLAGLFRVQLGIATSGTFTLTFDGQTTSAIAWNASAATILAALVALSSVGAGNVDVTGQAGGPYNVTFIGDLNATALALTGNGSGLTITDGAFAIRQQVFEVSDTDAGLTNAATLTAQLVRVNR